MLHPGNEEWARFLEWRGIEPADACEKCRGKGSYVYGHGSTWRGGMGPACTAEDICDGCWGSGNARRPWTDLRKQRDEEAGRVARKAAELFAERAGTSLTVCHEGVAELAAELERMANGRKRRASWFYSLCEVLARTLRQGLVVVRGVHPPRLMGPSPSDFSNMEIVNDDEGEV